jgi:hypothetical protein
MAKKEEKVANVISIIVLILAGLIIFSFVKPVSDRAGDIWTGLRGELSTLKAGDVFLPDGLVAYYNFDGNARDSIGNHHGEIHGVSSTAFGVYAQAYEFDTVGEYMDGSPDYARDEDYINIPFSRMDSLDFGGKEEITTSFWISLDEIPSNNDGGSRLLYWEDYTLAAYENERIEWLATDNGDGTYSAELNIITQTGVSEITCTKTLPYLEWHMLTGKKDREMIEVYLDGGFCGAAISSEAIYLTMSGNNAWIVSDSRADKKLGMDGKIDEVRIYNRALSSSEIALLYSGGLEVEITRDIRDNYYVDLDISTSELVDNEILMIVEQVPEGIYVPDYYYDWSADPIFNSNGTLVWLFAKNPPKYYGAINISQGIPASLIYTISGSSDKEFKGKWGLKSVNIDGFIEGECYLSEASC